MSSEGMSLPSIARVLALEDHVHDLTRRVTDLERQLAAERQARPGARVFAAGATGAVVSLRHGTRVRRATELVVWRPRHPDPPADGA